MAYYAFLNQDNVVTEVISGIDENQIVHGLTVEQYYSQLRNEPCVRTSYNGTIRKNYAGIGYTYDAARDAFIPPKPFPSWTLVESTCRWTAPKPHPSDDLIYKWDETNQEWVPVD